MVVGVGISLCTPPGAVGSKHAQSQGVTRRRFPAHAGHYGGPLKRQPTTAWCSLRKLPLTSGTGL
jgi:hypothetical protein